MKYFEKIAVGPDRLAKAISSRLTTLGRHPVVNNKQLFNLLSNKTSKQLKNIGERNVVAKYQTDRASRLVRGGESTVADYLTKITGV
jgi:hypothetical protein